MFVSRFFVCPPVTPKLHITYMFMLLCRFIQLVPRNYLCIYMEEPRPKRIRCGESVYEMLCMKPPLMNPTPRFFEEGNFLRPVNDAQNGLRPPMAISRRTDANAFIGNAYDACAAEHGIESGSVATSCIPVSPLHRVVQMPVRTFVDAPTKCVRRLQTRDTSTAHSPHFGKRGYKCARLPVRGATG